jgi:hypothetical protein
MEDIVMIFKRVCITIMMAACFIIFSGCRRDSAASILGNANLSNAIISSVFKENSMEGSVSFIPEDDNTLFLLKGLPLNTITKVDLINNKTDIVYEGSKNTQIAYTNYSNDGSKIFILEQKLPEYTTGEKHRVEAKPEDFNAFVLDIKENKRYEVKGAKQGFWNKDNSRFYAVLGEPVNLNGSTKMWIVEYSYLNGAVKELVSMANSHIQFQHITNEDSIYFVDNKGEGGVTLYSINSQTKTTSRLSMEGRFLATEKCAIFSTEGTYYFSFNEQSEKTFITSTKNLDKKTVFKEFKDTIGIQWLKGEKSALFLMGSGKGPGSGRASLYLYTLEDNKTKKLKDFEEAVEKIIVSNDNKELYYSYNENGKAMTKVMELQ